MISVSQKWVWIANSLGDLLAADTEQLIAQNL